MELRPCHYDVLEVPRDVQDDDLKKAYRKLALKVRTIGPHLRRCSHSRTRKPCVWRRTIPPTPPLPARVLAQWHPDKNIHQSDLATEKFKLVQAAYSVLSDPHERSWYDAHRESILRGGTGVAGEDEEDEQPGVNVWAHCTSSCYNGFGDDAAGFYGVYREVFSAIATDERRHSSGSRPSFGRSTSGWPEVREFYASWEGFSTSRLCAGADKYDTREAPNRQVRRAMEKENNKSRAEKRKQLNESVRALVGFVKKRDRRVAEHAAQLEAEKAARAAKLAIERRERQAQIDAERVAAKSALEAGRDEEQEAVLAAELDALLREYDDMEENGAPRGSGGGKKWKK